MNDASGTSVTESSPRKSYFIKIYCEMLESESLSLGAKCLYGRLAFFAGDNGKCHPSHATLAKSIGIKSGRQIRRYLAELQDAGLVSWRQTGSSCSYVLHEYRAERTYPSTPIGHIRPLGADKNVLQKEPVKETVKEVRDIDCPIPRNPAAVIPKPLPRKHPDVSLFLAQFRAGSGNPPVDAFPSDEVVVEIMHAIPERGDDWACREIGHIYHQRGFRWGVANGPRSFRWFIATLSGEDARQEARELARAPENTWDHDGTRLTQ